MVHKLLVASDAAAAERSNTQPPLRSYSHTRTHVSSGNYHVLICRSRYVAAVVIGPGQCIGDGVANFSPAKTAWYMRRLSVAPVAMADDALLGVRLVMHALEVATLGGADAVRCAINPAIIDVRKTLITLGFKMRSGPMSDTERKVEYLEWLA